MRKVLRLDIQMVVEGRIEKSTSRRREEMIGWRKSWERECLCDLPDMGHAWERLWGIPRKIP